MEDDFTNTQQQCLTEINLWVEFCIFFYCLRYGIKLKLYDFAISCAKEAENKNSGVNK